MGLLNRKKKASSQVTPAPVFTSIEEDVPPSFILEVVGDDEPLLTEDDHTPPVEEEVVVTHEMPLGVDRIRVGVTIKISRSYNTYESHFSAEGDPSRSSAEDVRRWVRAQCYDQIGQVLRDLNVMTNPTPKK